MPNWKEQQSKLFIGQWIRTKGFTPAEVSRRTGINEGYLSQLINGGKAKPSHELLTAIGKAINVPPHSLRERPPIKRDWLIV